MTDSSVAVVIPVYNRAISVLEALSSVASQSVLPRRVIVVDDGSTDNTFEAVRQWVNQTDGPISFQLVRQDNQGAAVARNRGTADVEQVDFIAYLDSDDLWPEDFIERTTQSLESFQNAVAASTNRRYVANGRTIQFDDTQPLAASPLKWLCMHGAGVLSCTMLRLKAIQTLGGFRDELLTGQDAELLLRIAAAGGWLHCPGKPTLYRREIACERGEHDHLCKSFDDFERRWAQIYEDFFERHADRRVLEEAFYRHHLAQRWSQAANQLIAAGKVRDARECLKHEIRWQFTPAAVMRLAQTYLRRAA